MTLTIVTPNDAMHNLTEYYVPDAGFVTIASGPADLWADAEACEAAHADRIVAALGLYVDTAWQQAAYAPSAPTPVPLSAPAGGSSPPALPRCAEVR